MRVAFLIAAGLVVGSAVQAAEPARPPAFQKLLDCRTISDGGARLACFDREVAAVGAAEGRKELVVVDQERVRKTRRTLFGLSLPKIDLFDEGDEKPLQEVLGTASSATSNGQGGWTIKLADGAIWTQTDDQPFALRPRAGSKIRIRRTALGAYMMSVDGQPGVRVRRIS